MDWLAHPDASLSWYSVRFLLPFSDLPYSSFYPLIFSIRAFEETALTEADVEDDALRGIDDD